MTATQTIIVTVTDANEAPVFTSGDSFDVAESSQTVATLSVTDDPTDRNISYQITGGVDGGKFEFAPGSADLRFKSAPDYGSPTDVGSTTPVNAAGNNEYVVTITTTSADPSDATRTLTTEQTIIVRVTDANEGPVFSTGTSFEVAENTQPVVTLATTDDDPSDTSISYQITGGVDSGKFELAPRTADLQFISAPDYESPTDVESTNPNNAAGNTEYVVEVEVRSGTGDRVLTAEQTIIVRVTDVSTLVFASPESFEVAENTQAVGTVSVIDDDPINTDITYQTTSGADSGEFEFVPGTTDLRFIAAPD